MHSEHSGASGKTKSRSKVTGPPHTAQIPEAPAPTRANASRICDTFTTSLNRIDTRQPSDGGLVELHGTHRLIGNLHALL
jgi:hypothetical protein